MNREVHVRFCGSLGVKFPQATRRKSWQNPHELGSVVARSLSQLRSSNPGVGWIRGDQVQRANAEEILRLRKIIEDLNKDLLQARIEAPPSTDHLAKGEDVFAHNIHQEVV